MADQPTFSDIALEIAGHVATITIARPEKRNALRIETYDELAAALDIVAHDVTVGAVVITGAGDRAFSAGGDLSMATSMLVSAHAAREHFFRRMLRVSTAITELSVPVIAEVRGACVGGGAEMTLFCDYVVASDDAYFIFNGTDIGGCSWWGAPQLLPLMVGMRRAQSILFESQRIEASEAARIGLINRSVPGSELRSTVDHLTERLLDLSADGIRLTKAALRSTAALLLSPMSAHAEMNAMAAAGPELQGAFESFLAGRQPDWRAQRPTGAPLHAPPPEKSQP